MEPQSSVTIGLFDPGMTHVHRVGLAGLYMTLKSFGSSEKVPGGLHYEPGPRRLTLSWSGEPKKAFDPFFRAAFGISRHTPDGLVDFAAHRGLGMGDLERIEHTKAVLNSFLQHNKQNNIPKGTSSKSFVLGLEEKQVLVEYRPLVKPYAHCEAAGLLPDKKSWSTKSAKIKGWLFPGAAERHSTLSGTEIEELPHRLICLLFAPVACLYYRIAHRGADGKFDERRATAVCFPHLTDLERYSRSYERYLQSPVERLSADGLGDAALSALLTLRAGDSLEDLGVKGCTAITMGTVGWAKQQRTRTSVAIWENVEESSLETFELAVRCLPNRLVVRSAKPTTKEPFAQNRYFVATSLARGLIGENIAENNHWFKGFGKLMCSKKHATIIGHEKRGLKQMVDEVEWPHEADKQFVEAVHAAIRNRYGALAARAKQQGETIRFDREFERMRAGLMRVKNAQTLRAEMADVFARGGLNKTLQKQWINLLPLFTGSDWQRARDLALLALASYAGKGAEQIQPENQEPFGEELE
jgi:CRISPR-associated protein Cas8a1/Csx13